MILRLGHPNILWSEQFPGADNWAVPRNLKQLQLVPRKREFTYCALSETRAYSSFRVYSWSVETLQSVLLGLLVAACLLTMGVLMFGGPDNNRPR